MTLVDAGSFTQAAEQMFIAQPTLSQQIRRLEEIVGTPLLQRRREGLRLTAAGAVLLDASRGATAALVWSGDLCRRLQQILFHTAERVTRSASQSWNGATDPDAVASAAST